MDREGPVAAQVAGPGPGAVTDYLRRQVDALTEGIGALREGDREAVHRTRVATRRYRSTLRTFRPAFAGPVRPLSDELRWLADSLGGSRDRQVLGATLADAWTAVPDPAIRRRLDQRCQAILSEEIENAWETAVLALADARCDAAMNDAAALAGRPVGPVDPDERLTAAAARVSRRVAAAADGAAAPMHDARIAAKRARYAAEAVGPHSGDPAAALARQQHYERLQDLFGRHQDLVVAEGFLDRVGDHLAPSDLAMARTAVGDRRQEAVGAALAAASGETQAS